ncbi:MAG TPA: hypothetical protein VGF53_08255 [Pseudolabrys sp.]|jgi:hypothetical protein
MSESVSDQDLARARSDAAFRQQMLADNLERLLAALKKLRNVASPGPQSARQLREGVELAVILADRLQKTAQHQDTAAA